MRSLAINNSIFSLRIFCAKIIIYCLCSIIFSINYPTSLHAKTFDRTSIVTEIYSALERESDICEQNLSITQNNNVIAVKGEVETRLQAEKIVEIISSFDDVEDVDTRDLKTCSSKEFLSDAYITAKAKGKIRYLALRNIIDPNYKIRVETTNKIVHLFGEVAKKRDIKNIVQTVENIIDAQGVKVNIQYKHKS